MQLLNSRVDLDEFHKRLARAGERVLLLDYDGTLAPFRVRPELALPYPGVSEALAALLASRGTRVVIVSGRRARDVAALLAPAVRPEIWGAHGWERLAPDGALEVEEPPADVKRALAEAHARAGNLRRSGARIEAKPASIALHWRGLPALTVARLARECAERWRPLAGGGVLEWLDFDGGAELRARGATKRRAVEAVLRESAPAAPAAYLGDDVTDEDAFLAMKGRGLAVLVRPERRESAADLWIRPPRELLEFLARWRCEEAVR
ncbi:MAG: trehalose-phosphatase [Burkholderiales bacterium]|nr:trehalose-phosphatase [Burkholderiales bacterium]